MSSIHSSETRAKSRCFESIGAPANAIDLALADEFATALEGVATTDGIRALVVTGVGSCFSAGLDLKAIPRTTERNNRRWSYK